MSKVSFRTRQIDFNRSLPIVRYDSDLFFELGEGAFVNRGAPTVPSGMEREEENEHHFIEVLQALQMQKNANVSIPVPEIIDKSEEYEKIYSATFSLPRNLIHIRTIALEDEESVEYDMDSDDEEWLRRSGLNLSSEGFECMIDRLERGCGHDVMNLEDAQLLLSGDQTTIIAVYDYWINKRVQCRQPLILSVRQEKRDGGSNNDPYVAFRRRTERMQTRKNRKNDEYSYEKMLLLREQMVSLGEVVSRLVKREVSKEAAIDVDRRVFQLRYKIEDWEATQLSEADAVAQKTPRSFERLFALSTRKHLASRKRRIPGRSLENALVDSSDTSDAEGSQARNDPTSFIRLSGCKYQRPSDCRCFPEAIREEMFFLSRIDRLCHNSRHTQTGYLRRRFGRGGRTHFDRVQSSKDVDSYLHRLDSLPSPPETQTLQLRRFDRSGGIIPCNGSPAAFISNEPPGTPTHPSLSPTNEDVLFKRFQFYLRSLSKHRLALSLSRLTGGRCISSGWFGSSGNSIYSRSISDTVYKISVSPSSNSLPPSDAGSSLVGKPASTTVAVKSVLAMRGKNHHQCRRGVDTALTDPLCPVVTFPSDGGDGAAVCGKGRVASLDSSATNGKALVLMANASATPPTKKAQLLNGGGTLHVTPREDGVFPLLPHQVTPARKNPVAVKNSNSREDGAASTDDKPSIIHPVVYNV
ncbi:enhancer of polycomb [Echinococcus multilocularis]|uniref:Enhancer of polycomb-like protein n=1 Tax=Echinococcus multilocularis TaxID=6211 RepID=A0A068YE65_ECHMU|nr:enhancer of polycomb [Echinococcus multilocularis]